MSQHRGLIVPGQTICADCADDETAPADRAGVLARRPAAGAIICEGLGSVLAGENEGHRLPKLLLHGIDSLYIAYHFETWGSLIDWELLAYKREQLRGRRNCTGEVFELGTETFWLKPFGKKPYSYILANSDFEVRLSEHMQPSCYVQFFSEGLWHQGWRALHERILAWARELRLTSTRTPVVSRVDWAFDFALPVLDFDERNIVTRARKKGRWTDGDAITGFQIGKGDLVIRLYDKVAEIEAQSAKVWMYDLWGQSEGVWRVEVQARGPYLQEHGIRTPEDMDSLQYDCLREVAANHTSLRTPNSDSNCTRWPLHPLWEGLNATIAGHPQEGLVRNLNPANSLRWRKYQQGKYLYGALKGLGALLSVNLPEDKVLSLTDTFKALRILMIKGEYDTAEWEADLLDRKRRYALGQW